MIIVHTLFVLQETRSGLVSYYDDRGDSVHTDVGYYSITSAASVFVAMSSVTVYSVSVATSTQSMVWHLRNLVVATVVSLS